MTELARTFRELEIWKLAVEIAKQTYLLTAHLPDDERFGLVAQMRRAAVSLSANIAEGFRRQGNKEFRQFLRIALGSAIELESHCELCKELFDGQWPETESLLMQLDRFERMTNSMWTKLGQWERTGTQSPSYPVTQVRV